ncbi:hypothetical protein GCM10023225_23250 [Kineococcus glutinatus]|uniref:Uncharacterized protein n=1 Tax=Kineococcus glutinatus TaxID=1070872 RepID=A0ABP9HZ69_9ACTN
MELGKFDQLEALANVYSWFSDVRWSSSSVAANASASATTSPLPAEAVLEEPAEVVDDEEVVSPLSSELEQPASVRARAAAAAAAAAGRRCRRLAGSVGEVGMTRD